MATRTNKSQQLDVISRQERARRGPAWRWQCTALVATYNRHHLFRRDQLLIAASRYRAKFDKGLDHAVQACREFPLIDRASVLEMWPEQTLPLKILILGGVPSEEIAQRTGLEIDVVETWQALFFDIGDNRTATDWLTLHVFQPEQVAGRGDHAIKLKMAASGGAAVARHLLDDPQAPPKDESDRLRKRRDKLNFLAEKAASMALHTPTDAQRFLELHARIGFEQQRLDLAERRFTEKQLENARRHELRLARLRAAEQRAAVPRPSSSSPKSRDRATPPVAEPQPVGAPASMSATCSPAVLGPMNNPQDFDTPGLPNKQVPQFNLENKP